MIRKANLIGDGCRLEQISFALGLLPYFVRCRPELIWLQEGTLGEVLLTFRKWFGFTYKLIFCDGAPLGDEFSRKFDYTIFLHSYALKSALNHGTPSQRCTVIPYISKRPTRKITKLDARKNLDIADGAFVIICVAAWNSHHKRIDYLLREVARINSSKVTLLLCGQEEAETSRLKLLAEEFSIDVRWHTLTQDELSDAYAASDLFVLPSLTEGLGLVLIEAGLHALPIISHPHEGSRFILGESYEGLTDLSEEGGLANKISELYASDRMVEIGKEIRLSVSKRFDRDILVQKFLEFVAQITR